MKLVCVGVGCAMCLLLAGCPEPIKKKEASGVAVVTAEADKGGVVPDARLLEKCKPVTDKLANGTDDETVRWARSVLKSASDCAKNNNGLIDWVKKTFNLED